MPKTGSSHTMEKEFISSKATHTGVSDNNGVSFSASLSFEIPVGTRYAECLKTLDGLFEGIRERVKESIEDERSPMSRALEPELREQLAAAKEQYKLKLEDLMNAVQNSEVSPELSAEVHALGEAYMYKLRMLRGAIAPEYPRVKKIIAAAGTPACTPTPPQTAAR